MKAIYMDEPAPYLNHMSPSGSTELYPIKKYVMEHEVNPKAWEDCRSAIEEILKDSHDSRLDRIGATRVNEIRLIVLKSWERGPISGRETSQRDFFFVVTISRAIKAKLEAEE